MESIYKNKYLKYKNKYLNLKMMLGGESYGIINTLKESKHIIKNPVAGITHTTTSIKQRMECLNYKPNTIGEIQSKLQTIIKNYKLLEYMLNLNNPIIITIDQLKSILNNEIVNVVVTQNSDEQIKYKITEYNIESKITEYKNNKEIENKYNSNLFSSFKNRLLLLIQVLNNMTSILDRDVSSYVDVNLIKLYKIYIVFINDLVGGDKYSIENIKNIKKEVYFILSKIDCYCKKFTNIITDDMTLLNNCLPDSIQVKVKVTI